MNESWGQAIRIERFKKNLTQEQVSKILGIPIDTISKYESVKIRNPNLKNIKKLTDFYNINFIDIVNKIE
ncbi:helix-turn-helix domain-containing protein [Cytobacillus kochii]|uniref:helix-turn-helix domain-containing protein n=1 Tax=Cytobacillus kochii TaxID=859143 RepID=UPI0027806F97|nr:helix-turn-helix transcriptional regulator [Cytobacillus kochii]MDQ0186301.1 transcriptional regulator with XRE-family HTH domain [Cytobacillus kochii]